ncbi:MAG: M23 family metallopeptidase [Oscillospiraceae bacterium]|nr:M23 family metallopeptidase [Oscillospiraceae bacterium]
MSKSKNSKKIFILILFLLISFIKTKFIINSQEPKQNNLYYNKNIILNKTTAISPLLQKNITSYFGYRFHPISYNLDFHPAIDISAPTKSKIRAILPGTVKEVGNSKIYGNYIIISHDNNLESKYCHCDQIFFKKYNRVSKGQVISSVGNTGLSTGSHLHLEIKINNINIDPLLLIKF